MKSTEGSRRESFLLFWSFFIYDEMGSRFIWKEERQFISEGQKLYSLSYWEISNVGEEKKKEEKSEEDEGESLVIL